MLRLNSKDLLHAVGYIASANKYVAVLRQALLETGNHSVQIDSAEYLAIGICAQWLEKLAVEHGLLATKAAAIRLVDAIKNSAENCYELENPTLKLIDSYTSQLVTVVQDELNSRLIFTMPPGHADYYAPPEALFGPVVEDYFPLSSQEIADAGRCRALGQWTACVMHLMRALEPALNAICSQYGVATEQNWNKALNEIDQKLRSISKSKDGAEAERWASEAVMHIRAIKNAWRNYAMHGRARYNEEEAIAIYSNVKSFMQQLAAHLTTLSADPK